MVPLVAAALVAASVGVSAYSSRQKRKATNAQVNLEVSQAKVQAEEQALQATRQYREYLSYNVALAGAGVGGTTGFRGVAVKADRTIREDLNNLKKQVRFAEVSGKATIAAAGTEAFVNTMKSGLEAVGMASDLGLFSKGTWKSGSTMPKNKTYGTKSTFRTNY